MECGGLEELDTLPLSGVASVRFGILPCLLRSRAVWDSGLGSSNRVLQWGMLTARLLVAEGLELDEDDGPTIGAMVLCCEEVSGSDL